MGHSLSLGKKSFYVMLLVLLGMITQTLLGCCQTPVLTSKEAEKIPGVYSTYLVYWDRRAGTEELQHLGKSFSSVSFFAGYFNSEKKVFIDPEIIKARKQEKIKTPKAFLTIVNDVVDKDGKAKGKDTAILEEIWQTPETTEAHIDQILALAQSQNFTGLEIDYENIWKKPALPGKFISFLQKLQPKAAKAGLKIRVVLEPSVPFQDVNWPQGPEYVVMFYNLYGTHSKEAGPKADKDFIYKLCYKAKSLPKPWTIALSTGGCLWSSKSKPRFVTEREARELVKKHQVTMKRDPKSMCLVGRFREDTTVYDLWYGDKDTLQQWIIWAKQSGNGNIALWRLGGNISLKEANLN